MAALFATVNASLDHTEGSNCHSRRSGGRASGETGSMGSYIPKLVKLDFPKFNGDKDPTSWVCRADQFFEFHQTPEAEKVPLASCNLEGDAQLWYQLMKDNEEMVTWGSFKDQLHARCVLLSAREADDKYIASVHSKNHINLIKNISSRQFDARRNRLSTRYNSIYFNEGSSLSAYLAAGSVIDVAERVAKGELDSAFAIVRPPGHHAEQDEPMGFCLYNNVAIATNFILNERPEFGIKKILLVDWDVHHGNGTQKMFWKDSRVLFFSVHRHEFGTFYPANGDGSYTMVGEGPGAGYTVNVPWEHAQCGDPDYIAVWDHVLLPITKAYNPDMIIISAGFDAAAGDPLGGCHVTPYGYSVMLKKLMEFAQGRIVMALEGGYNLKSIANSVRACMEVLLQDRPLMGSSEAYPFESTWRVIEAVRKQLSSFWPTLTDELPKQKTIREAPLYVLISSSDSESESEGQISVSETSAEVIQAIMHPFSELTINKDNAGSQLVSDKQDTVCASWRSELSKIDIWYASFGSNMWTPRFLCYIRGGQVEGMQKPCPGSLDKSPPKEISWTTVPHRLFFGRDYTHTWGPGGVAFLHPGSSIQDTAHMCLYRITLEQFNDVLFQENVSLLERNASNNLNVPLFDLTALDSVTSEGYMSLETVKKGWYHNVVFMGKEHDIPILTMTCPLVDIENFKSGKAPLGPPSREYANTLIRGLVEGKKLPKEEAIAYIEEAITKPL